MTAINTSQAVPDGSGRRLEELEVQREEGEGAGVVGSDLRWTKKSKVSEQLISYIYIFDMPYDVT